VRYVGQKFVQLVIVVIAVTFLTSMLIRLLPGDPALFKAGPGATPEQLEQIRDDLGLNDPVPVQYVKWLGRFVTGDWGISTQANTKIFTMVKDRLPISLMIMFYAQLMALIVAIPLGILAAYRNGSLTDRAVNTTAFGALSIPNFVLAVVFVLVFSVRLQWFPATSKYYNPITDPVEHFKAFFLPSLVIAIGLAAGYIRLLRADMVGTLQSDFITMARAKGMSTRRILYVHALRPSSFSLITAAAVNIGVLIGGTVIVEQTFQLSGMGYLTVFSIGVRDYEVVQACVAIFALIFVLSNFFVDLAYGWLDPRIRHARALA
jgi:peptide/nickel transport system permease protein